MSRQLLIPNQLFNIRDNTYFSRGWAYAYKVTSPTTERRYCEHCGRTATLLGEDIEIEIEGGTKYPDFLQSSDEPVFLVNKKVIEDWLEAGFSGFTFHHVRINKVNSKKLSTLEVPDYKRVIITHFACPNVDEMNVKIKKCNSCESIRYYESIWKYPPSFSVEPNSWGGTDIFSSAYFKNFMFCTEKVFQLIKIKKYSNFRVIGIEDTLKPNVRSII